MRTPTTLVAASLLAVLTIAAAAQEKKAEPAAKTEPTFTAAQLAERMLHRRAVDGACRRSMPS